ncbi:MAG: DUF1501 domain-containing protein [SAR202 cluster bacterium]|jgi:uncharacterized protein (DUF1501 family)|nr:DUF1501 domain-containing protein [SAR202 cluster bacterium]|tara:strand:- start:693 stop:1838 length:1146 start_codon:yes stop_codon:yes gene_type:complete
MVTEKRPRSLVILQLSGGNDALNTVIPYGDGLYYDWRKDVHIEQEKVLQIDSYLGFNPALRSIKHLWDQEKVAVINGVGYPDPNRSHFRSIDIWNTCESIGIGDSGWLGRALRELDPKAENPIAGVNFGKGLPRALSCKGVPVASVSDLENYGLFPDIRGQQSRDLALSAFSQIYGSAMAHDNVSQFIGQTGIDALKGADILRTAPGQYSSDIEYANNPIAQSMKSIAQVLTADIGTRVFYTQHGSFDTHAAELETHSRLWTETSDAIGDFMEDMKEHNLQEDVLVLVWSEFGRRIRDNSAGTDHGSGGVAFAIGGNVKGGLYGEYPSLKESDHLEGDLHFNNDFRSIYSTIAERWLDVDPDTVSNGHYEQHEFIAPLAAN